MTHEQVLELVARRRLADLLAAAVADADDLAVGSTISKLMTSRACDRSGRRSGSSRSSRCGRRRRARIRGGIVRVDVAERLELLVELQHVDPRLHGDGRSSMSISKIWFISFTSTRIPFRSGTAPSVRPVPPARGITGMPHVGELDDLRDLLGARRQNDRVRDVFRPPVGRERRRYTGAVETRRGSGEHVLLAADVDELADDRIRRVAIAISHLESGRFGHELEDVVDLDPLRLALLLEWPLRPGARRHERGDTLQRLRLLDSSSADLGGQSGFSTHRVRAGARAVRPLGHVIDVDERQTRNRPQDLPRSLPDSHALVQTARIVVRDRPFDRRRQLDPAVPDHLCDDVERQHDLELVEALVERRIVLDDRDVVVRIRQITLVVPVFRQSIMLCSAILCATST